jgi:hypothetical protein
MFRRLLLVLALALPSVAGAHILRWVDDTGRLHYANRSADAPPWAEVVTADIGYFAAPRKALPPEAQAVRADTAADECHAIRRRLGEIDDFGRYFKARQLVRLLERYPESYIVPDFLVADQWLRLSAEQAWLWDALRQLERRRRGQG